MSEQDHDNNYSIIALFVVILILAFFIGRLTKKQIEPVQEPDISHFQKTIDSLVAIGYRRADTIRFQKLKLDSLATAKVKNHKIVKKRLDEIKTFTPDSRLRWRDSVRRADGL